ncbi:MAG: DUF2752 domain-containing protein [Flavobacteriales bacterium]|nr:DUF2752 domain-containing protein [Flavobacteriales bacterium]MCB9184604.1 DUF2752 domain-containing protein [Flavobacteriales bacterium]
MVVYLALPAALAVIPLEWVSEGPVLCLHKRLTGEDCLGCGLTRALFRMLHGDIGLAVALNRGVLVAGPLLAFLWLSEVVRHVLVLFPQALGGRTKGLSP